MHSNIKVIQPSGILDSTQTHELRQCIAEAVEHGATLILVDLKQVTFMDSSGLGALVTALKAVRAAGGQLCVCSINEQVKILFELTSMDRVFDIFPDCEAFLNQCRRTESDFEEPVYSHV